MEVVDCPADSEECASLTARDEPLEARDSCQLQRLVALPAGESGNASGRHHRQQHQNYVRPFPGRLDFDTFGDDAQSVPHQQRCGHRPGETQWARYSTSTDSRMKPGRTGYQSRGDFFEGFQRDKSERRARGGPFAQSLPESICSSVRTLRMEEVRQSLASEKSEELRDLVQAMVYGKRGGVATKIAAWPREKMGAGNSFDKEVPESSCNNTKVPGRWLIDQAKAAIEAGASGRLSFAPSSVVVVEGEELSGNCSPLPGQEQQQQEQQQQQQRHSDSSKESAVKYDASIVDTKGSGQPRRLAMDYGVSTLAGISFLRTHSPEIKGPVWECRNVSGPEGEAFCSKPKSKSRHQIPIACFFLLGVAVSSLVIGAHRKICGHNDSPDEI